MTRKLSIIIMAFTLLNSHAYADSIQSGAKEYDWQICIDSKQGDCLNGCQTSEDINCGDNCAVLAKDKCLAEGLRPSQ